MKYLGNRQKLDIQLHLDQILFIIVNKSTEKEKKNQDVWLHIIKHKEKNLVKLLIN
jgi:hypothetical protein